MTGSFAWAASPDAFMDEFEAEGILQTTSEAGPSLVHVENHEHSLPGQSCNHGCHLSAHLVGVFSADSVEAYVPQSQISYLPADLNQVKSPYLKGPYRPPLATPLV